MLTSLIFLFLCLVAKASTLKNITLITTGGTIAGRETPGEPGYQPGVLSADEILAPLAGRLNHVRINIETFANIGSHELTWSQLNKLGSVVLAKLGDPTQQGVVILIGSDHAATAAFGIHLWTVHHSTKPVVFVIAYRPATAISADGPANTLDGVNIAASPQASGRGTLFTENGFIHSAAYVQKAHTIYPGGFASAGPGPVGYVENSQAFFYFRPSMPLGLEGVAFSRPSNNMPRVEILVAHTDLQPGSIKDFVRSTRAEGLVLVGMGAGSWPPGTLTELRDIVADGKVIVAVARPTWEGPVSNPDVGIPCGLLDAQKCRVGLQILLSRGYSRSQVESFLRGEGKPANIETSSSVLISSSRWAVAFDHLPNTCLVT